MNNCVFTMLFLFLLTLIGITIGVFLIPNIVYGCFLIFICIGIALLIKMIFDHIN